MSLYDSTSDRGLDREHKPRKPQRSDGSPGESRPVLPHLMTLRASHRTRPVSARWQIAQAITRGDISASFFADDIDDWVAQALDFLTHLNACSSVADFEQLAQRQPHVHAAWQLFESPDKLARGTVEARLLAGQSIEETASLCALAPQTVLTYERLFFAVTHQLKYWLFLLSAAVSPMFPSRVCEDDVDIILRGVGLCRGPLMVDHMLDYLKYRWSIPEAPDKLSREAAAELAARIKTAALVKALVGPRSVAEQAELLRTLAMELESLLEIWPAQTDDGARLGHSGQTSAALEAWWQVWRPLVLGLIPNRQIASTRCGAEREV